MAKLLQPVKLLRDRYQLQIAQGRELLLREVRPTGGEFDHFKAAVERWDTENRQLINQTYDDPTVLNEYTSRPPAPFHADIKQAILSLKDDVQFYVQQLEKIDAGLRSEKTPGGCGAALLVITFGVVAVVVSMAHLLTS